MKSKPGFIFIAGGNKLNTAATYKTRQREQILDCLIKNQDRHITADEILFELNGKQPPVGKTTVYRHLDKLVSQGTVRRYFIEEGKSACYQYMESGSGCTRHYHLKCTGCGQLFHTQCEYLGELDSHIRQQHGFHVDHSKTVLYGRCGSCAGKPEESACCMGKAGAEKHRCFGQEVE